MRRYLTYLGLLVLAGVFLAVGGFELRRVVLAASAGDALISEVLYDCPGGCSEPGCEWVELYNNTESSISVEGWEICDGNSCDTLPDYTIASGNGVVIAGSEDSFEDCGYSCGTGHTLYVGRIGSGLNNTSDVVCILDGSEKIIDQMNWGEPTIGANSKCSESLLWDPGVDDVSAGHSLQRNPIDMDTDTRGDFEDNDSPSPCETPNRVTISHFQAVHAFRQSVALLAIVFVGGGLAALRRRKLC